MADKAIEPGKKSTERYLPESAWKAMSKAERKKTDDKKKRESRKGKQFVENTEKAKRARRMASKKAKKSRKGKQFVENTEKAKRARRMASKKAKKSMKND